MTTIEEAPAGIDGDVPHEELASSMDPLYQSCRKGQP